MGTIECDASRWVRDASLQLPAKTRGCFCIPIDVHTGRQQPFFVVT